MRVQRSIPTKDSELLEMSTTYYDAIKNSKLFENSAAQLLAEVLADCRNRFKTACDEARFRDLLKVAARNQVKKELIAALKRVIHYIEAMATDEDLLDLQKAGVRLSKIRTSKKKKSPAEVEPVPAGA